MDSVKKVFLLSQIHELQGVKLDAEEGEGALQTFLGLCGTFEGKAAELSFDSEPSGFAKALRDGKGDQ